MCQQEKKKITKARIGKFLKINSMTHRLGQLGVSIGTQQLGQFEGTELSKWIKSLGLTIKQVVGNDGKKKFVGDVEKIGIAFNILCDQALYLHTTLWERFDESPPEDLQVGETT